MPKKIETTPIVPTNANEERLAQAGEAAKELNALQLIATDNAKAMALRVGYEGSLTAGAIEDEIRFYQRQTVETCLELGKRLLVLKELTPHGEFSKRVALLGFEQTKAQRFMKAAAATVKNSNLQLLSERTKAFSTFWEIVMNDDDVIENILEWDDLDGMSASEVRALARSLRGDNEANDKLMADKNAKIDKLTRDNKKGMAAPTNWEDAFKPLHDQEHVAVTQIALKLSDIHNVINAALQVEVPEVEEASLHQARTVLAKKIQVDLATAAEQLEAMKHYFDKTLEGWL